MAELAILGGPPVRGDKGFPEWPQVGEAEVRYVENVVRSGRWWRLVEPSLVAEFEDRFAQYHDAKHGLAVTNGTAALELVMQAIGLEPGDEVIVPPYTFFATASCVLENNGIPVFVDIDPETYNLDATKLEEAITPRTKAIIPVHFAGLPADMDAINEIARKHGLIVVEDCAHAHGAIWNGRKVGAIGDIGCFSFQQSKNMTSGEGGIILTDDEALKKLCFSFHFFGREEGRPLLEYHRLGSNHRMTELQAAILLAQLERVEEQTELRAQNGAYLSSQLSQIEGITPIESSDPRVTRRAYHLYVFKYRADAFNGISKDLFCEALTKEGIPAFPGYMATVYQNPVFQEKRFPITSEAAKKVDYTQVKCPVAEQAVEEAVFVPHSVLLGTKEDMDDIVEAVHKVQKQSAALAASASTIKSGGLDYGR